MFRVSNFGWTLVSWALLAGLAAGHDFAIDLEVKTPKGNQTVHAQISALGQKPIPALGEKPKPRVALQVKSGDKMTVKWSLRSTATKDTAKDVLVHFYVVKISRLGEPPPPKVDRDKVVAETALTMDFKPKDKTEAELHFQIDQPGFYLLRLETGRLETTGAAVEPDDHQHFAALDLIVQ